MTPIHKRKLLDVSNAKSVKGAKLGYLNAIHYMAPSDFAGVGNLCPWASEGCKAACLGLYSGNAFFPNVRQSRIDKAKSFMNDRKAYYRALLLQIDQAQLQAEFEGKKIVIRLDGSTDIGWKEIYNARPNIQFVEYTKSLKRILNWLEGKYAPNVHFTFSASENNESDCDEVMRRGGNVSVVYRGDMPKTWQFIPRVDPEGGFDSGGFIYPTW